MKLSRIVCVVIVGLVLVGFATLSYAVPKVINYQGRFTDKDDNPLTGNYLVTFRFYDVPAEGAALWEEGHILSVDRGIFTALLGSLKPLDLDFNKDLWLSIEVGSDGEMSPRIKLTSSAYAFNAQTIDMIESGQLVRNDIDSVMAGNLTLKKDLILKGDASSPSRIILMDAQGRDYYLWVDNAGNLRIKQGLPSSDKDGSAILKDQGCPLSSRFGKNVNFILVIVAVLIISIVLYSSKKKK